MSNFRLLPPDDADERGGFRILPSEPVKPTDLVNWKGVGAKLPSWQRELISSINGWIPTAADEAIGGGVALASRIPFVGGDLKNLPMGDVYRGARDIARGAQESYQKEHPVRDTALNLAIGLHPGSALTSGAGWLASKIPGGAIPKAMAVGGAFGIGTGVGAAGEMSDIPASAVMGGLTGAALGGASTGVLQGTGAVVNNVIKPRLSQKSAQAVADQKVAQAFARDQIPSGQVQKTLADLGPEARLVDAGGMNARSLLDLQASLPGKTQQNLEAAIRDRQAGRASRLSVGADEVLGTQGQRAITTLDEMQRRQQQIAGPLYQKVNATTIDIDDDLKTIIGRASDALGEARKRATAKGEPFILGDIEKLPAQAPLRQLDTIKQTLFDLAEATRSPVTGKVSGYGRDLTDLRHALVSKLDDMTTDPKTKESFYKAARDAFAGEAELQSAVREGMNALKMRPWEISKATERMSASERQAFQIGAMESLREKMGTEGGQTSLLKFWKEPATAERLQQIFPDFKSYADFARMLTGEGKLKAIETLGAARNSKTFAREAAQDDQLGGLLAEAATMPHGGVAGLLKAAKTMYGRAAVPGPVRDKIGEQLLMPRAEAQGLLGGLDLLKQYEAQKRNATAGQGVAFTTQLQQMLSR